MVWLQKRAETWVSRFMQHQYNWTDSIHLSKLEYHFFALNDLDRNCTHKICHWHLVINILVTVWTTVLHQTVWAGQCQWRISVSMLICHQKRSFPSQLFCSPRWIMWLSWSSAVWTHDLELNHKFDDFSLDLQLDLDLNASDLRLHLDLSLLTWKYLIPSPRPKDLKSLSD